jgi:hypothetical protein
MMNKLSIYFFLFKIMPKPMIAGRTELKKKTESVAVIITSEGMP